MENKFRYILFPDNIYKVTLKDSENNPIEVEVPGRFILSQLQRTYDIDSKMLDNNR
tara:strand:+ start:350 stop:517 length:168 start_codon:yes stop_codon:yes gene_type:complete